MTVAQMKIFLAELPDDANICFSLWQSDDKYTHFSMSEGSGRILKEKGTKNKYVSIGHADNCNAHRIVMK